MPRFIPLFLSALLVGSFVSAQSYPPDFVRELVASGIDEPTDLAVRPDGKLLVLKRDGEIRLVDPTPSTGGGTIYMTLSNLDTDGEKGLTSIALDPGFASNGYFYLYYHSASANRARLSRFTDSGNHAHATTEKVLWQDPQPLNQHPSPYHWGGALVFADDGTLLLGIGDKWDVPGESQDLSKSAGKLLRLDPAGLDSGGPWQTGGHNPHLVPQDNPWVDGSGGNLDEIFSRGLRNPFRAHADPESDRIFISEVGGNVNNGPDASWEDLHVARLSQPARNYGWPNCEGPNCTGSTPSNYSAPVFSLQHPEGFAMLVGPVYRQGAFPSSYNDKVFIADHTKGWVRTLSINGSGNITTPTGNNGGSFASSTALGRPTAMQFGNDGSLYATNWVNDRVYRIRYTGSNQSPVILSATANATSASSAPFTVQFTADAFDPEGQSLDFDWDFGDGSSANGASVSHTYTSIGTYEAQVVVSDSNFTVVSDPITIAIGSPPTASIDFYPQAPFIAGQPISVVGSGYDPDESLGLDDLRWTVRFLHNDHTHPVFSNSLGSSCPGMSSSTSCADVTIPTTGHDFSGMTGYEVTLTATDSTGLSSSTSVVLNPLKVNMTVTTNVPGSANLVLDGLQRIGPFTHDTLVGFVHQLVAPPTIVAGGDSWAFSSWSTGESDRTINVTVPGADFTRQALYVNTGPAGRDELGILALYTFDEGGGATVADSSGYGLPLDLTIQDPGNVQWGSGTLEVTAPTSILSNGAATKISTAIRDAGEFTLEAWVAPSNLNQSGPARVAGISTDTGRRNLTLGQGGPGSGPGNFANLRLRTSQTSENGEPSTSGPSGSIGTALQHVVFTRDVTGVLRHFVDGQEVLSSTALGTFDSWVTSYPLVVANEATGDRPWLGTFGLLAFYDRALSPSDVLLNYQANNPGDGNQLPVARVDEFTTDEDTWFIGNMLDDNGNGADFDPDGDLFGVYTINGVPEPPLSWIDLPSGARIIYLHDGTFFYTPRGAHDALRPGQTYTDGFSYGIYDGPTTSDTGAVVIEVTGVNDPPFIVGDSSRTIDERELLIVPLTLGDPEGDDTTMSVVQGPPFLDLFFFQGQGYIIGFPFVGDAGNYTIVVRAFDAGTPNMTYDHVLDLTVLPE